MFVAIYLRKLNSNISYRKKRLLKKWKFNMNNKKRLKIKFK